MVTLQGWPSKKYHASKLFPRKTKRSLLQFADWSRTACCECLWGCAETWLAHLQRTLARSAGWSALGVCQRYSLLDVSWFLCKKRISQCWLWQSFSLGLAWLLALFFDGVRMLQEDTVKSDSDKPDNKSVWWCLVGASLKLSFLVEIFQDRSWIWLKYVYFCSTPSHFLEGETHPWIRKTVISCELRWIYALGYMEFGNKTHGGSDIYVPKKENIWVMVASLVRSESSPSFSVVSMLLNFGQV